MTSALTDDEIIELAKKLGDDWDSTLPEDKEFLFTFARLIAERQKEIDAGICDSASKFDYWTCGDAGGRLDKGTAHHCAAAIRGQT